MINLWLNAIRELLLAAPGSDLDVLEPDEMWESTLERLGDVSLETARADHVFYDYLEADDITERLPFFVLTEGEVFWKPVAYAGAKATGIIEVAYGERSLSDVPHTEAKLHFVQWTGHLIAWMATQNEQGGVSFDRIEQTVFPQRTPRAKRDKTRPNTDYFWAAWEFHVY